MRKHGSHPPEQVFAVTGLPASLHDDQGERMRRYLMSMGIRTACFILAVVAVVWLHWTAVGWVLVVAAVILPYIAVVMANATRSRRIVALGPVPPTMPGQLPNGSAPHDDHDAPGANGSVPNGRVNDEDPDR